MEPEARYALVGSVVLAIVVGLVVAVVWLVSTVGSDERAYEIVFERQSLEGLQVRGEVRMRGIRVGSVTGYEFSVTKPGAVRVFISVAASTPVRTSTRAIVDRHLVTGIAAIRLLNLDETSPLLPRQKPGQPPPIIAEGQSELQQFAGTIAQLAQRVDETMRRVNTLLSPENEAAFAETLDNVRKLSANANRAVERLQSRYDRVGAEAETTIRETAAMVRDVTVTTEQLRAEMTRLADRTDDLMSSGNSELRYTAREIRSAADALGVAARKLSSPRSALFGPPDAGLGPGEGKR